MSRRSIKRNAKKHAQELLCKLLSEPHNEPLGANASIPGSDSQKENSIGDHIADVQMSSPEEINEIKSNDPNPSFGNACCKEISDDLNSDHSIENDFDSDNLRESDFDSDHSIENESEISLRTFLSDWSIRHAISVNAMNKLLRKLKSVDHTLPLDVRTLRETPKNTDIMEMGSGTYMHYGLQNCLTDFFFSTKRRG